MKSVSIYDLSQRCQVEDEAAKRKTGKLPPPLQGGSAYDLNHVKAVTEHSQNGRQQKSAQQGGSPYDCSIKH